MYLAAKIRMTDSETIDVFLEGIISSAEAVEENYLKRSAEVIKKNIKDQLNSIKTSTNRAGHKHMADDVQANVVRDKYGYKVARIKGGKRTGTKWHLVNDGTYRSDATHFMDKAIAQSESEVNKIFEEEMNRGGF
ncbi:HK97-gp10 family putative phage morphogenesis protein [Natronincola ferrireducens]|nr:HK97-gp10 family putative phage morphogenesis protein [Natronincola ferrireducens]